MPDAIGALAAALEATGIPFAQFGWSKAPAGTYGVWAEESAEDLGANGHHAERGTIVTVDVYTREAAGAIRDSVEAALNGLPVSWRLDSIQYENETGLVHLYWRCGVYG